MPHRIDGLPRWGVPVAARLAWAGVLLLVPGRLLRPVGPASTGAVVTLRVLGVRHAVQAVVTGLRPTPGVFAAGAAVDGLHSITSLALAAVDRRQRHAALTDAAVAAGWAVLGAVVARHRGEP